MSQSVRFKKASDQINVLGDITNKPTNVKVPKLNFSTLEKPQSLFDWKGTFADNLSNQRNVFDKQSFPQGSSTPRVESLSNSGNSDPVIAISEEEKKLHDEKLETWKQLQNDICLKKEEIREKDKEIQEFKKMSENLTLSKEKRLLEIQEEIDSFESQIPDNLVESIKTSQSFEKSISFQGQQILDWNDFQNNQTRNLQLQERRLDIEI